MNIMDARRCASNQNDFVLQLFLPHLSIEHIRCGVMRESVSRPKIINQKIANLRSRKHIIAQLQTIDPERSNANSQRKLRRLPEHLQAQWRKKIFPQLHDHRDPTHHPIYLRHKRNKTGAVRRVHKLRQTEPNRCHCSQINRISQIIKSLHNRELGKIQQLHLSRSQFFRSVPRTVLFRINKITQHRSFRTQNRFGKQPVRVTDLLHPFDKIF